MVGIVLFALLFAALSWWLMRQAVTFILQSLMRIVGRETDAARRLAALGHHTALDPIALIVGLGSGLIVVLLPDGVRSILLGPGLLILWGVTIVLYLVNRYVFAVEDAGRRGF